MKKKFEKLTGLVTLLIIIIGILDLSISQHEKELNDYYSVLSEFKVMVDQKIRSHPLKEGENQTIKFDSKGLYGGCGFIYDPNSPDRYYTYGEKINGTEVASQIIMQFRNKPADSYPFFDLKISYKWIGYSKWGIIILALILSIFALIYGFKWKSGEEKESITP